MMNFKPIKTDRDYQNCLARFEEVFDAPKGTPESEELEILSLLIDDYENKSFPTDFPDPIEAVKFRMEQSGYTQTDLARVIGEKSRASEIMNKKRKLSLSMIRELHRQWAIPTDVLIQAY